MIVTNPSPSVLGRAFRYLGPAVVYVAYIFVMGSLADVSPPMGTSDKTAHFVAFGLMVPLLWRAERFFSVDLRAPHSALVAVCTSSLLGGLLELWQAFLPHRSADVFDWLADSAGAALAGALLLAVRVLVARRSGGADG